MTRTATVAGLVIALIVMTTAGCVFTPGLNRIQNMVAEEIEPATMKTEIKLNLGPLAMSAAKLVTRLASVEEEGLEYLNCIDHVELNIQKISGLSSIHGIRWPRELDRRLEEEGWEVLVRAREDEEIVLVLYKSHRKTIRSMFVLVLDTHELVLVKVDGELDTLVMEALEDHAFTDGFAGEFR
jgi:hypothetical protein